MMTSNRAEAIQTAVGPLPPFIVDLREKIRKARKTQTRRVIKSQPRYHNRPLKANLVWYPRGMTGKPDSIYFDDSRVVFPAEAVHFCPYGQAEEVLYLREPLIKWTDGLAHFYDDGAKCLDEFGNGVPWRWQRSVLPQIFMPKTVARTFVELTQVRGERLQAISQVDALAEGLNEASETDRLTAEYYKMPVSIYQYASLWDQINRRRGFRWDTNPWVWVLTFEKVYFIGETEFSLLADLEGKNDEAD